MLRRSCETFKAVETTAKVQELLHPVVCFKRIVLFKANAESQVCKVTDSKHVAVKDYFTDYSKHFLPIFHSQANSPPIIRPLRIREGEGLHMLH